MNSPLSPRRSTTSMLSGGIVPDNIRSTPDVGANSGESRKRWKRRWSQVVRQASLTSVIVSGESGAEYESRADIRSGPDASST
jgi:hypothetical protein